jgi:hypothetical protein
MAIPSELLRQVAQRLSAKADARGDVWRPLADSVTRYANGKEQYSDFLRVDSHRDIILNSISGGADRAIVEAWLKSLLKPVPGPPLSSPGY